jgi:hypothetical protein
MSFFTTSEQEQLEEALRFSSALHAEIQMEEERKMNEAIAASIVAAQEQSTTIEEHIMSQDDGRLLRSDVIDITSVFGLVSRHGGERLRLLGLQWGVTLLLKHSDGTPILPKRATSTFPGYKGTSRNDDRCLMEMVGTSTALMIAVKAFQKEVLENSTGFRAMCHARWNENAFLVVDNSSTFISAQYGDGGERDLGVRVSIPGLCDVVRGGRNPRLQFAAGSHCGAGSPAWKSAYEKEGFEVYVEKRHHSSGEKEMLLEKAMSVLNADFGRGELSQTIILLSGDGRTFPGVVDRFMQHNADREASGRYPLWNVEIVTWRRAMSKEMEVLRDAYPGYISIRYLDEHRAYVTYRDDSRLDVAPLAKGGKGKGKEQPKGACVTYRAHSRWDVAPIAKGKGPEKSKGAYGSISNGKGRGRGHCTTLWEGTWQGGLHYFGQDGERNGFTGGRGASRGEGSSTSERKASASGRGIGRHEGSSISQANRKGGFRYGGKGQGTSWDGKHERYKEGGSDWQKSWQNQASILCDGKGGNASKGRRHEINSIMPVPVLSFTVYSNETKLSALAVLKLFVSKQGGSLLGVELRQFYDAHPDCKDVIKKCKIKELCNDFPDQGLRFEGGASPADHRIVITERDTEEGDGTSSASLFSDAELDTSPIVVEGPQIEDCFENSEGEEDNDCIICMAVERSQELFLSPCRHRGFCHECARMFVSQPCPVCRTNVMEVLNLY